MAQIDQVLQEIFGYPSFRQGQRAAIDALLSGRDVQVLMPTGGGKSLCYQIPAIVQRALGKGPTIVISPLIALIDDQVDSLRRVGVDALSIHSAQTPDERRANERRIGDATLVYLSPERFGSERFRRVVRAADPSFVVVDEAHCISEWGHDFRPAYRRLCLLKEELAVPTMALTATATRRVLEDIAQNLELRRPALVETPFHRPNLEFGVEHHRGNKARSARLLELLEELDLGRDVARGRVVVYATSRKRAKEMATELKGAGYRADYYHAGRTDGARERVLQRFDEGNRPILVATCAFGMGIDYPDIRLVCHVQAPLSLEAYYQEAGRAGRDGGSSRCVLLYSAIDGRLQSMIRKREPNAVADETWRALTDYVFSLRCRQQHFRAHFTGDSGEACGICDVCSSSSEVASMVGTTRARTSRERREREVKQAAEREVELEAAQLEQIVCFIDALRRPLGRRYVAQGLRGSKGRAVVRKRLDSNPAYGTLRGIPELAIFAGIDRLLSAGRLVPKGKKYPTLWIADKPVRPPRGTASSGSARRSSRSGCSSGHARTCGGSGARTCRRSRSPARTSPW
ncbi:MAG: ATP-dependent DNA helicase RecQ, partial [Myxococcales bacterium]|nr:ATP-dependent DNA helicase RecQ [Myxococcales bacterium]